jgi:hypothetical protein
LPWQMDRTCWPNPMATKVPGLNPLGLLVMGLSERCVFCVK